MTDSLTALRVMALITMATFIGFYLFYLLICLVFKRAKQGRKSVLPATKDLPKVSILIPTYNEARVISQKIENFKLLDYPRDKLEAVFVDGGSTDGTADLIENLARKSNLSIRLIRQSYRKGFNRAVIEGFSETTGDAICITGAETEYDKEALKLLVGHFSDPGIGAVTGRLEIKNIQDGYAPKLESAYRGLYDLVRMAESNIDSPFDIKGEISAVRRSVLRHLVEEPRLQQRGAIDTCISFQAKMDREKTDYEPRAVYYELSPTSIHDSFKQGTRRAAALIENMMTFKTMIFNRRFGAFGMLIMPSHFLMLTLLPFVLTAGVAAIALLMAFDPSNYLLAAILLAATFAIVLSKSLQAFLKTQLVLIIATLGLFFRIETQTFDTQTFERISSARPD